MDIKRAGTQASAKGPADWFTGTVRIDPLFQAPDPALVQGASVTFEPAARTAWHTHPLGQTLIVTAGCGRVQRGLVCTRRKTLARCSADNGHDAYCDPGKARWQGGGLDGARDRCGVRCGINAYTRVRPDTEEQSRSSAVQIGSATRSCNDAITA
jgi:hypothetical protein